MSFKVVHSSDHHHGLLTHGSETPMGNTRSYDSFQAFDQLIDFSIKNKVKLIINSGDIFNHKSMNQNVVNSFYERVKRITDNGIDFFMLFGNHDANPRAKCGLDLAKTLALPRVYATNGSDPVFDLGYTQIYAPSYWDSVEILEEKIDAAAAKIDWNRPAFLVGHLQVEFANFPGSFKEDLPFTPLALLTKHPFTAVNLGHIHTYQKLNDKPPVHYAGSLVRTSFNEEHEEKGFTVYTIDGVKAIKIERQTVDCLKMLTLKGNMSQLKNKLELVDSKRFTNTIIRVIVDESEEIIDEKWLQDKFSSSFKVIITKESKRVVLQRIDGSKINNMQDALREYFADQIDRDDLLTLVEELKNQELKAIER